MKRFFALFVVLIFMVSAMCIPVFAANSIVFERSGSKFITSDQLVPGEYTVVVSNPATSDKLEITKPYYIDFVPDNSFIIPSIDILHNGEPTTYFFGISWWEGAIEFVMMDDVDNSFPMDDGFTVTFIPLVTETAPHITDFVSSDMLSGALDQVVALIPVVVGCIVAFVGIRKGISFLQQIMHSA